MYSKLKNLKRLFYLSCTQALHFESRFADAWINLGLALWGLGSVQEACASLEKGQELGHPMAAEIIREVRSAAKETAHAPEQLPARRSQKAPGGLGSL